MSVEVRPFRSACNLRCTYCYQAPQRARGPRPRYSLDQVMEALRTEISSFTLFGGEPLLLPVEELDRLFSYGFERFGHNGIQTNGTLIDDAHIDLFRRYNVSVGISVDGPAHLNAERTSVNPTRTDAATARTHAAIKRLCREWKPPSLIVTLSRANGTKEHLPTLVAWIRELHALGVTSIRVHPLEINDDPRSAGLLLSHQETLAALTTLANLSQAGDGPIVDIADETWRLLLGRDDQVSCTWLACDPLTTPAVRGITGEGHVSRCGRADKEGRDGTKADRPGYERYIALYQTPTEEGGCSGCRFFMLCKGHCPGTGIDGDWRNRSRDCEMLTALFEQYEERAVEAGHQPLSLHPLRESMERELVDGWMRGQNLALGQLEQQQEAGVEEWERFTMPRFHRLVWDDQEMRDKWRDRIVSIKHAVPTLMAHAVHGDLVDSARIRLPAYRLGGLRRLTGDLGLEFVLHKSISDELRVLGDDLFLDGTIRTGRKGSPPQCVGCSTAANEGDAVQAPGSPANNMALAPLGLQLIPMLPCSERCQEGSKLGDALVDLAAAIGLREPIGWLIELLSLSVLRTSLHGIAILRTPWFQLVTDDPYRGALLRHEVRFAGGHQWGAHVGPLIGSR